MWIVYVAKDLDETWSAQKFAETEASSMEVLRVVSREELTRMIDPSFTSTWQTSLPLSDIQMVSQSMQWQRLHLRPDGKITGTSVLDIHWEDPDSDVFASYDDSPGNEFRRLMFEASRNSSNTARTHKPKWVASRRHSAKVSEVQRAVLQTLPLVWT